MAPSLSAVRNRSGTRAEAGALTIIDTTIDASRRLMIQVPFLAASEPGHRNRTTRIEPLAPGVLDLQVADSTMVRRFKREVADIHRFVTSKRRFEAGNHRRPGPDNGIKPSPGGYFPPSGIRVAERVESQHRCHDAPRARGMFTRRSAALTTRSSASPADRPRNRLFHDQLRFRPPSDRPK